MSISQTATSGSFPEILRLAGLTVERHQDHFAPDTADETGLEAVGQRGWIALTLAHAFVATRSRVERFLDQHRPPFIAKVYRPSQAETLRGVGTGRVELWYPLRHATSLS
jgi:hypothetical protein